MKIYNNNRNMMYVLVYDDNTHTRYLDMLLSSVRKHGKDVNIIKFDKKDIDINFMNTHKSILNMKRGGGYWLWKPYIINNILNKINDNDIIFYIDSSYYFTEDFTELYSSHMMNNDLLIWKNKPNESSNYMKILCKMDVIMKYDMYDKVCIENAEECWAGALIIKKTTNTVKYMKEWLDMCCIYEDITDSPSKLQNNEGFYDHRHDQSLLSIIVHKYNIKLNFFEKKYLQNVRQPY